MTSVDLNESLILYFFLVDQVNVPQPGRKIVLKIAPSILSADFAALGSQVNEAIGGGADYIHVDVMDGHFVPNITVGPLVVRALRQITDITLDTHLMIENPGKYIPAFAKAGSSILTVHIETCPDIGKTFDLIRKHGVKPGLTLSPPTPFSAVEKWLGEIDLLLIMTVNPGFGAQDFMPEMIDKIKRAADLKQKNGHGFEIEVDGGISEKTVSQVYQAGARVMVAGNAVFGKGGIKENIRKIRSACCPPD
jgi:ribulose-phosphate 3-epimerase